MNKIHNTLMTKNSAYAAWHNQKYHKPVHWVVLLATGLLFTTLVLAQIAGVHGVKSAASSFTCDFYASPSGPLGNGNGTTEANAFALRTALGQPNLLSGNKTLCLKGGTYKGKFRSTLNGGTVRSAPGEVAVIDGYAWTTLTQAINSTQKTFTVTDASIIAPSITSGASDTIIIDGEAMFYPTFSGNTVTVSERPAAGSSTGAVSHSQGAKVRVAFSQLEVEGSNTTYRDLEITNSDPLRDWRTDGEEGIRGAGIFNLGSGNKFINNAIHNNLNGIFSGSASTNSEYYGNISYNNGAFDLPPGPTGAGHGAYIENSGGYMRFYENIMLNNFNHSIQLYGRSAQSVGGEILGNVFSGAGAPLNSGVRNRNIILGPEVARMPSVNFSNNFLYHPLNIPAYQMILGYGAGVGNGTVTNNYFIGGEGTGLEVENTTSATITGNKFYMPAGGATNIRTPGSGYTVNSNTYYGTGTSDDKFGVNGNTVNFTSWKSSGYDASGSASASALPDTVIVRANTYEPGRANIIVMAASRPSSVTVNLSQAGLTPGQSYKIRNASNWRNPDGTTTDVTFTPSGGSSGTSATYSSGQTVNIPLSGSNISVARPNGLSVTPTSSCPELCVFVVIPTTAGTGAPAAPVINSFTASAMSGGSSTLSWNVTGATSLSINNGVGTVTGSSTTVSPTTTTTYTLTATNSGGSVTANVTVTVTATPQPTGTINATNCTIASGASTCNSSVTWTTSNLISGANTAVTRDNPTGTQVSTNTSGTNVSNTVKYGTSNYFLYHNNVQLATKAITASCASGTTWNNTTCATTTTTNPQITTTSMPSAQSGVPYTHTFTATGGQTPYTWAAIVSNSVPSQISSSGVFTTTLTGTSARTVVVTLTDATGRKVSKRYTLRISGSGGSPTGTINATNCTIASGASTCNSSVTWTTSNLISGANTAVTRDNPTGTQVSTNTSGTNVSNTVKYGTSNYFLYHNNVQLATKAITASCASGTTWNNTTCATTTQPAGPLTVTPTSVSFTAALGTNPPTKTVVLKNTSTGAVSWNATYPPDSWCHLDSTSDSLAAGAQMNIGVYVDDLYTAGSYNCNITFTATGHNSTLTMPVTYVVN